MKFIITLLVPFLLLGCATLRQAPQVLFPSDTAAAQKPAAEEPKPLTETPEEKKSPPAEQIALPKFEKVVAPKPLPPAQVIDPKKVVHAEEPVRINVESLPISELIVHALGGTLKVNVYIDEQVKNMKDPVTLRMADPLPPDKVFEIVLGVLEKKNLIVEEKAGTLYILRSRPGAASPVDIRVGREVPDSPASIIQVVVLKYARPAEIDPLIREFYKTGIAVKIHPRENALILSGQASAIRGVMDLIQVFDVPYVEGKKAFILKLLYWQADEFAKQISQVLEGIGFNIARTTRDPGIFFIPIRFLNSVLVLTPDETAAKYVLDWKERLDTPESAGAEEKAFTYVPDYAKAADIVESIRKVYGISQPQPPAQFPGQQPMQFPGLLPGAYQPAPQPPAPRAQPGQPGAPRAAAGQLPAPPVAAPELKIAADERRNVVLVVTTPANYKSILTLLKELDTPVKQVLIEATIAELLLTDELSLGFEFFIKQKVKDGTLDISTLSSELAPLAVAGPVGGAGLTLQFISAGEKFAALLKALQTERKVNILSRPRLMVLDNQEATIQVGSDVPTQGSTVSSPDVGTISNIQYRSTGVVLRIKPTINAKGLLTLDISQEVSTAQATNPAFLPPGANSPTVQTRNLKTSVVAGDGQTVVLGGIMQENSSRGETKIPWLGDIPWLGFLFRQDTSNRDKTELIILIEPRILASVEETTRVTEELRQELKWLK